MIACSKEFVKIRHIDQCIKKGAPNLCASYLKAVIGQVIQQRRYNILTSAHSSDVSWSYRGIDSVIGVRSVHLDYVFYLPDTTFPF